MNDQKIVQSEVIFSNYLVDYLDFMIIITHMTIAFFNNFSCNMNNNSENNNINDKKPESGKKLCKIKVRVIS